METPKYTELIGLWEVLNDPIIYERVQGTCL
ncbi:hypothetical protein IKQ_00481 [Bacillus cereus VDM053]|nr:hypothetical protein IKQ_00481 [Bacillus cereus VDM053]